MTTKWPYLHVSPVIRVVFFSSWPKRHENKDVVRFFFSKLFHHSFMHNLKHLHIYIVYQDTYESVFFINYLHLFWSCLEWNTASIWNFDSESSLELSVQCTRASPVNFTKKLFTLISLVTSNIARPSTISKLVKVLHSFTGSQWMLSSLMVPVIFDITFSFAILSYSDHLVVPGGRWKLRITVSEIMPFTNNKIPRSKRDFSKTLHLLI